MTIELISRDSENLNLKIEREFTEQDQQYMQEAIDLATSVLYLTSPNPHVGCVIVKQNRVIGRGATQKAGQAHAEVMAIEAVREQFGGLAPELLRGSTFYITLEPCAHQGRTPPCVDELIRLGVSRVVVSMLDPNPLVAGRALKSLIKAGIEVGCGLLADESFELNKGFVSRMVQGRPWIRTKLALSLDGFMCRPDGESQWITHQEARSDGQHWRASSCAILTGSGTLIKDQQARLTVRDISTQRQPDRFVIDTQGRVSYQHPFFREKKAHSLRAKAGYLGQHSMFINECVIEHTLALDEQKGHIHLEALIELFAQNEYNTILVEAGPRLNSVLMNAGLIDEMIIYYAPKILGQGMSPFEYIETHELNLNASFSCVGVKAFGEDIRHQLVKQSRVQSLRQAVEHDIILSR